ncbi:MAG: hypothetical protein CMJ23_02475 [Phycisphaerae bacterium]|nr:hypothetical protein [Phycisphaerae bacterium]
MASTESEFQPGRAVRSPDLAPQRDEPCGSFWISDQRRGRYERYLRGLVVLVMVAIHARPAFAEIALAARAAVVIRGGELALPLTAGPDTKTWPQTVDARCGGRTIEGRVGWIVPRPLEETRWTSPVEPVSIITIGDGEPSPVGGSPIVVLTVPMDAEGTIEILGSTWTPEWRNPIPPFDPAESIITGRGSEADPPLDDPMEWYRWAIRADLEGGRPPSPEPGPEADASLFRRVAVSLATEWLAALARVREASPGIASEIAERLVATVVDDRRPMGDRTIAAWPTDSRSLAGLRRVLLDPKLDPMEAARAGLAWFEVRPPFLAWVREPGGDRTAIELVNPTADELVVLATWTDAGGTQALLVPPRSLVRRTVERPALQGGPNPTEETLQLAVGKRTRRLVLGPRALPVRPPGRGFGPITLLRTLGGVDQGFLEVPPADSETAAVLRRRFGRWEIFIEALTPAGTNSKDIIYLSFGPGSSPVEILELRSDGGFESRQGSSAAGLEVKIRRFPDRWRAQVTVPESWLVRSITDSRAGAVLLGLRRDGPDGFISFAGPPPPAWRREIPVQTFAIGAWQDPEPTEAVGKPRP